MRDSATTLIELSLVTRPTAVIASTSVVMATTECTIATTRILITEVAVVRSTRIDLLLTTEALWSTADTRWPITLIIVLILRR